MVISDVLIEDIYKTLIKLPMETIEPLVVRLRGELIAAQRAAAAAAAVSPAELVQAPSDGS